MKKPRYTEQQIAQALRQVEQGTPATEVCRKLGVSETTFWSSQDLVDSSSIQAVAEGDADVHEGERGASPVGVRVHQGQ